DTTTLVRPSKRGECPNAVGRTKSSAGCPGVSLWRPEAEPLTASSLGFFL
ncbi:hypothetical protein A2U01_0078202, partial [Trifolium medium]|nr:hypothetical protein [Trifolium medium]